MGAITTKEAMRLDISKLRKDGYLERGAQVTGYLDWSNGASISFRTYYAQSAYIELAYKYHNEIKRYKIEIELLPSNLGTGWIPYFVCPARSTRTRTLYLTYGSSVFMSRQAYNKRLYYPAQLCSKYQRALTRYWETGEQIEKLETLRNQTHYNGKPTKRYQRYQRLKQRQAEASLQSWDPDYLPKSIREIVNEAQIIY